MQKTLKRPKSAAAKVKTILVTQPRPDSDKSPYFDLAGKFKLKIDFRPFIHVEGIPCIEFRKNKINLADFSSVILTSRHAADHFFRICQEMRMPDLDRFKYFCVSESTAFYLQKYVQYRKRKIFFGRQTIYDLIDILKKHKEDQFLLPCSDIHKQEIPDTLEHNGIQFTKAIIYRTVCNDLADLAEVNYDMLVFFSPSGITSLFKNFPKFKQNKTRIAAFGQTTSQAVADAGLRLDVRAPVPDAPSMTMAIEHYLRKANK